jgi:hypothetical protein
MGIAEAIIGSSVISAGAGLFASKKASDAQKKAAKKGADAQLEMYYQSRADMMPWMEAGQWALGRPADSEAAISAATDGTEATGLYDELRPGRYEDVGNVLRASPGYKFRLEEGTKAIQRGAAAKSGALSGKTQKALLRYGQDYASGEYDKAYNRMINRDQQRIENLFRLAGYGTSAGNVLTQAGTTTGRGVAQNALYGGQARASGYINAANALTGGVRSGMQDYMFYNYLKNNPVN